MLVAPNLKETFSKLCGNCHTKSDWMELAIITLLCAFVSLIPFPRLMAPRQICFYLPILLTAVMLYQKKTVISFRLPITLPFVMFFVWVTATIFISIDVENSTHDIYAYLFAPFVLVIVFANFFVSEKRFSKLVVLYIIASTIFGMYYMYHDYVILKLPFGTKLGLTNAWTEIPSNWIGIFTTTGVVLALTALTEKSNIYKKMVFFVCMLMLIVTSLAVNANATNLTLLVTGFLLICFHIRKYLIAVSLFLIVLILLATNMPVRDMLTMSVMQGKVTRELTGSRVPNWERYWEILKDHPIAGIGFGMESLEQTELRDQYNPLLSPEKRTDFTDPHNMFVSVATRTGFLGLALYLSIIITFLYAVLRLAFKGSTPFIKKWGTAVAIAFIAFLIQGQFQPVVGNSVTDVFYFTIALGMILWRMQQASANN